MGIDFVRPSIPRRAAEAPVDSLERHVHRHDIPQRPSRERESREAIAGEHDPAAGLLERRSHDDPAVNVVFNEEDGGSVFAGGTAASSLLTVMSPFMPRAKCRAMVAAEPDSSVAVGCNARDVEQTVIERTMEAPTTSVDAADSRDGGCLTNPLLTAW